MHFFAKALQATNQSRFYAFFFPSGGREKQTDGLLWWEGGLSCTFLFRGLDGYEKTGDIFATWIRQVFFSYGDYGCAWFLQTLGDFPWCFMFFCWVFVGVSGVFLVFANFWVIFYFGPYRFGPLWDSFFLFF